MTITGKEKNDYDYQNRTNHIVTMEPALMAIHSFWDWDLDFVPGASIKTSSESKQNS